MPRKFDHAFSVAFSVISDDERGENISSLQFANALQKRIHDLCLNGEWDEAVGAPFDTFEVEDA